MNARVVGVISQTNPNPSSSFAGTPTTTGAIAIGDKVIAILDIRNTNPTGISFTVGGNAFTEDTAARVTRTDTQVVMYWDATSAVASGATMAGSWTNTGTQDGGGAQAQVIAITPDTGTSFTTGASVARGTANGLTTNPRIPAGAGTVTPPSSTAKYLALTSFIITSAGTAGETVTLPAPWTQFAVVNEATRGISIWSGYQEMTAPAAALAAVWTAPSHNWAGALILIEQPSASAPSNTAAPVVSGTASVGSTLSTTDGTWSGSPTSFSYQWQRDVGTGAVTWVDIAGATANTYVVPGSSTVAYDDVGSKLRCRVTATNASGSSAPTPSNATAAAVPAPAGQLAWRVVVPQTAGSDHQWRQFAVQKPVLDGDLLVLCVSCSNADLVDGNGNKQDVGYVSDGHGNTWTQLVEDQSALGGNAVAARNTPATLDANGIDHSVQIFSAHAAGGFAYQDPITMTVQKAGGAPTGDGDALAYHGQSPYWFVVAVSTGDSRVLNFDAGNHACDVLTSHTTPTVASTNNDAIAIALHSAGCAPGATSGWWTPGTGWTEVADAPTANGNGGETDYQIAGQVKVSAAGISSTSDGTTAANRKVNSALAVFSAAASSTPVSATAAMPIETTQGVAKAIAGVVEALGGVAAAPDLVIESQGSGSPVVNATAILPIDTTQDVFKGTVPRVMLDVLSSVSQAVAVPIEATAPVLASAAAVLEALGSVAGSSAAQIEMLGRIARAVSTPIEALGLSLAAQLLLYNGETAKLVLVDEPA